MSRTCIETASGRYFDYMSPCSQDINIGDIARSLAMTVRYRGHVSKFYSVAEHCVLVRQLVIEAGRPDLGLGALLHDAHEAYLGDVPTPLKRALGRKWESIASEVDLGIAANLDVPLRDLHEPEVVVADALCLRHETAVLKVSQGTGEHWGHTYPAWRSNFIRCWSPSEAEKTFLRAYNEDLDWRSGNL